MTDGEPESRGRPGLQAALRWLSIVAAIAGIVGTVVTVAQWIESRPNADPPAAVAPSATGAAATTGIATNDDATIKVGLCVRDAGGVDTPQLKVTPCGPGALLVLARIEEDFSQESDAVVACQAQAPGYSDYHFSTVPQAAGTQVVYCLKEQ
ncbi:hypothetical protein [Catellatospora sp. NPDC049133]|uniref:hypothetical protein n=1 Tax=Catellatospora sp. NPDC049133 TaxID=3155499 RepID=UPI0033D4F833